MDIVYIVKKNGIDNFELRCSLRSIAQYGVGIDNVFVVGDCPDWLSDEVIKIPHVQPYNGKLSQDQKNANIASSVLKACMDKRVGDHFLVSMDDHYLTQSTDFNNYPIHLRKYPYFWGKNSKYFTELPDRSVGVAYTDFLHRSRMRLKEQGLPHYNFTLHHNLHIWKQDILDNFYTITNMINTSEIAEIFVWAGNYRLHTGELKLEDCLPIFDNKICGDHREWYKSCDGYCFSTSDFEKDSYMYKLMERLYPNKCKYEK